MKNDSDKAFAILLVYIIIFSTVCILIGSELNQTKNTLKRTQNELALAVENLDLECEKSDKLVAELDDTTTKLTEANKTILDLKDTEYELIYMGEFKLTHYCTMKYEHICGTGDGITATGTQVIAGRTIAVDPKVIPYGTKVYIPGYGWRVAEDCGGAIKNKHIDIAIETHEEAMAKGVKSGDVWILVEKGS